MLSLDLRHLWLQSFLLVFLFLTVWSVVPHLFLLFVSLVSWGTLVAGIFSHASLKSTIYCILSSESGIAAVCLIIIINTLALLTVFLPAYVRLQFGNFDGFLLGSFIGLQCFAVSVWVSWCFLSFFDSSICCLSLCIFFSCSVFSDLISARWATSSSIFMTAFISSRMHWITLVLGCCGSSFFTHPRLVSSILWADLGSIACQFWWGAACGSLLLVSGLLVWLVLLNGYFHSHGMSCRIGHISQRLDVSWFFLSHISCLKCASWPENVILLGICIWF